MKPHRHPDSRSPGGDFHVATFKRLLPIRSAAWCAERLGKRVLFNKRREVGQRGSAKSS